MTFFNILRGEKPIDDTVANKPKCAKTVDAKEWKGAATWVDGTRTTLVQVGMRFVIIFVVIFHSYAQCLLLTND